MESARTNAKDLITRRAKERDILTPDDILKVPNFTTREKAWARLQSEIEDVAMPEEDKKIFVTDQTASMARVAATDRTAEKETGHMLTGLAPLLPNNPRQIKRIINAITILQQVARIWMSDFQPIAKDVKWQQLARWIVIMTEWPQTWYTLTKMPEIIDWVLPHRGKTPRTDENRKLSAYAALIRDNEPVKKLLLMPEPADGWEGKPIIAKDIQWLANIIPATSGSLLEQPKPKKENDEVR